MNLVPHVVAQGEYLTQLAFRYRFEAKEVWDHPKHADLRARRSNRECPRHPSC